MGTLPLGPSQRDMDPTDGAAIICDAVRGGIDLLDTAEYYDTYRHIAAAFVILREEGQQLPRISSRSLAETHEEMESAILACIEALSVPCIDTFMLHEVVSLADFTERSGALSALISAKEKGLIQNIGVSTHHTDVALAMAEEPAIDTVFVLFNKDGLGIRTEDHAGTAEEMAAAIYANKDAGKNVMAMKVFGGGNLVADYTDCLDFVTKTPGITTVVIGMAEPGDVKSALEYFSGTLPEDYVPNTADKKMHVEQSDCLGCGSCKNRCTGNAIFWNENGLAEIDQTKCVRCGYCAPVCPVRAVIFY